MTGLRDPRRRRGRHNHTHTTVMLAMGAAAAAAAVAAVAAVAATAAETATATVLLAGLDNPPRHEKCLRGGNYQALDVLARLTAFLLICCCTGCRLRALPSWCLAVPDLFLCPACFAESRD